MGVGVWSFLRPQPGELRPLAHRAAEAFVFAGGRLPVDADGFVLCAQVIVSLLDRRPRQILRVGFHKYRAHPDGTLDREHLREIMEAIPEAAFGALSDPNPLLGVIDAGQKFARRRLEHLSQWKPTGDDLAALRDLVNRRAGRELL